MRISPSAAPLTVTASVDSAGAETRLARTHGRDRERDFAMMERQQRNKATLGNKAEEEQQEENLKHASKHTKVSTASSEHENTLQTCTSYNNEQEHGSETPTQTFIFPSLSR